MTENLDLWVHDQGAVPRAYGEPTTYHQAYEFLADCSSVQDWGCAYAYGRQFFPEGVYRGIDGSKWAASYADEIADLTTYRPDPKPEGIVMRHVLEHNLAWRDILANAVDSFTQKFCLIMFVPFGAATRQISAAAANGVVLSFRREDITGHFSGCVWSEEYLATDTQFGGETIFCVGRLP